MHAGRGRAPWRAAGAVLVACVLEARAQETTPLIVSPPGQRVEMRVGQRRGFSAVLAEPGAEYAWSFDGGPTGKGPQFEFRPTAAFVGTHEVSVTALAGSKAARHTWSVAVEAVGPPTIVRAVPDVAVVRVPAGEPLAFELHVEPAALTDTVNVRWSLEGAPVGEGARLVVRAPASGAQRLRAVASSEYGGAAVREWQIVASADAPAAAAPPPATQEIVPDPELAEIVRRAPTKKPPPPAQAEKDTRLASKSLEPETARPKTLPRRPPPEKAPATKKPVERASVAPAPSEPAAPPLAPPAPAPAGVTEDDVRALMFRYEQAWRTRNAAELRRIGHIDTDAQEQALTKYFETTNELEVAVHVLDLHAEGGRGIVRFTRRDHFRDPAGREVSQESPPIEKTVVRTPEGVRFAPRS